MFHYIIYFSINYSIYFYIIYYTQHHTIACMNRSGRSEILMVPIRLYHVDEEYEIPFVLLVRYDDGEGKHRISVSIQKERI